MSTTGFRRNATALAVEGRAVWIGTSDGLAVTAAGDKPARPLRVLSGSAVTALALSRGGAQIIAGDANGRVSIHETAGGAPVDALQCNEGVAQLAILGPRVYVTVDVFREGLLWSPRDDGTLAATPISDGGVPIPFDSFGVSPGGERLTLRDSLGWRIWDRAGASIVSRHEPIDGMRLSYVSGIVEVSANGAFVLVYWDDALIFDAVTAALRSQGPTHGPPSAGAVSDDGTLMVIGEQGGRVLLLDQSDEPRAAVDVTSARIGAATLGDGVAAWLDDRGGFGVIDPATGSEIIGRAGGQEWLSRIP
ncbi:MAG: hypothetical protein ACXW31_06825 [Thermoanaerobaculia bacterium]